MWYGKGPGVDRSGDAFRCANMLGTHRLGGVLAVAGDDHGAQSSTYPHQTEHVFQGVMMPILNPASVQDILDFGLAGIALSRYCGLWTALKTTAETAEQAATVLVPAERAFVTPEHRLPPHPIGYDPTLVYPADRFELERRVMEERLPALARLGAREPRSTAVFSGPTMRRSASSPSAARIWIPCTRCAGWALPTIRSSRCTKSACRGRWKPRVCAPSPAASARCW